jgi:hypothetical protein
MYIFLLLAFLRWPQMSMSLFEITLLSWISTIFYLGLLENLPFPAFLTL